MQDLLAPMSVMTLVGIHTVMRSRRLFAATIGRARMRFTLSTAKVGEIPMLTPKATTVFSKSTLSTLPVSDMICSRYLSHRLTLRPHMQSIAIASAGSRGPAVREEQP